MSEVISVRFRGGSKTYYFDPRGIAVRTGQDVIVSTAQGAEFASCTRGNHEVPESAVVKPLSALIRVATDADRRTVEYHRRREKEAFGIAERKIAAHGLEMKLVSVATNFEGNKIVFYFTADGRVDFRALVRDLAAVFRSRIELRQIGVRDEARMIGGLGICGRPFCCSEFLDNFLPVSIKMAKAQDLSLNPAKISGTCGRLMCCLKYEQHAYEDAARRLPREGSFVQTPDGPGNVKSVELLRERVKVSLDSEPESLKTYHGDEILVLRNGKGSRDGIEVPPPPPRHVDERPEDPLSEDAGRAREGSGAAWSAPRNEERRRDRRPKTGPQRRDPPPARDARPPQKRTAAQGRPPEEGGEAKRRGRNYYRNRGRGNKGGGRPGRDG